MRVTVLEAADLLKTGNVVAVATETVYGLAASLFHPAAIEQIFTLKNRPAANPLIIHVADATQIEQFTESLSFEFLQLAKSFWPGPMTLVTEILSEKISAKVRAGLTTAAFRIPSHPLTLELLRLTGPLVMPSANLSGKPSATSPEHVEADFGIHFPVLDGGVCINGLESTILYFNQEEWVIIRQGALSAEIFHPVLGYTPIIENGTQKERPICPGQLFRHYAPQAKLMLVKHFTNKENQIIVGFSDRVYPVGSVVYPLGELSKPETIAHNLYSVLRQLDVDGIEAALVDDDFPSDGILASVRERLLKAASK